MGVVYLVGTLQVRCGGSHTRCWDSSGAQRLFPYVGVGCAPCSHILATVDETCDLSRWDFSLLEKSHAFIVASTERREIQVGPSTERVWGTSFQTSQPSSPSAQVWDHRIASLRCQRTGRRAVGGVKVLGVARPGRASCDRDLKWLPGGRRGVWVGPVRPQCPLFTEGFQPWHPAH